MFYSQGQGYTPAHFLFILEKDLQLQRISFRQCSYIQVDQLDQLHFFSETNGKVQKDKYVHAFLFSLAEYALKNLF